MSRGVERRPAGFARGGQYSASAHDWDPATTVHLFKPVIDGEPWYVKVYFLGPSEGSAVFISVHR